MKNILRTSLLVLLFVVLLPVGMARANSTPAWSMPGSGGLVTPARTLDVRIDRETLSFDFTSDIAAPKVKAVYELTNVSGRDATLDLLFIAPSRDAPSLALDGNPLKVEAAPNAQLPVEWLAPRTGIDPRTGEDYPIRDYAGTMGTTVAWAFRLSLPATGRGSMTAEYESRTGYDRNRADYVIRHLGYVLGPARNWAGFGTLEVSATLPDRYLLAAKPDLQRIGDSNGVATFRATFDGVSDEILRLSTISAPQPLSPWVGPIGFFFPFLPSVLVGIGAGVLLASLRRWYFAFLAAGTVGYFASAMVAGGLTMLLMATPPLASASEDLSDLSGITYTQIASALFLAPFFGSVLAAIWAAVASYRKGRRGPVPSSRGVEATPER